MKVNVAESMSRRQWSTDEFSAVLSAHTEMVSRFIYHSNEISNPEQSRPLVKSAYQKNYFLISQPKHMLWVLKRTVSMRRFF